MAGPVLQKHYSVAAMQRGVSYNGVMSLPSGVTAAAFTPVLADAPKQVHVEIPGLPILLVLVLVVVIAGIVWARRRSRSGAKVPDRPDEWPHHPELRPEGEKEGPARGSN
jgi:hypothetical protein